MNQGPGGGRPFWGRLRGRFRRGPGRGPETDATSDSGGRGTSGGIVGAKIDG